MQHADSLKYGMSIRSNPLNAMKGCEVLLRVAKPLSFRTQYGMSGLEDLLDKTLPKTNTCLRFELE